MKRRERSTCAFLLSFALILTACIQNTPAAYLEESGDHRRPEVVEPPIVIPPRPRPENALIRLARQLDVGSPTSYRGLTVFPLVMRRPAGGRDIRTLDEALNRDWIVIHEKDRATVSELRVRNDSGHRIFLMSGEIITGGKQNRIVREDVLLGPRSRFVSVPVYCGEKERWTESTGSFSSPRTMADLSLRQMSSKSESQEGIWREIEGRMDAAKVQSRTRNYQQIFEDKEVNRRLSDYVSEFRRCCGGRTVGVVVMSGWRIVGCDLFSDPRLLSALWDKICRSYALDPILRPAPYREQFRRHDGRAEDVRRFLDRIQHSGFSGAGTPGEGSRLVVRGAAEGDALLWRDEVVHAALFPGHTVRPMRRR
jgi:hypothetical protein